MTPCLADLCPVRESADLPGNSTSTHDEVSRCCIFLREHERFDRPISFHLIGALLGLDQKTVWDYHTRFRIFGLEDSDHGPPSCLTERQIKPVIQHNLKHLYRMVLVTATGLAHLVRDQFHFNIQPDTLRGLWTCVT
jgi:hypothetical protein